MSPLEIVIAIAVILATLTLVVRQVAAIRDARELNEAQRFASDIIDNAGEGIVVCDRELRCILWNRFMAELTGFGEAEVLGRPAAVVFPEMFGDQGEDLLQQALEGEQVSSPDLHYQISATGRSGWMSAVFRPHRNAEENIIGVTVLVRDITARKAAEQQIEYQAYHDSLTGLANRRLFREHLTLALALAQRRRSIVAVLFLDLDNFKLVNDSLGHSVGDLLLIQIARRLKSVVREGDTVARVGGDEFTIVVQELARPEHAAVVARKVLRSVAEPVEISGQRLYVTTSIGVTLFPDHGDDAEALLKAADGAMYQAKAAGRNNWQFATRELSRTTEERMTVENDLHRAIEEGEFELLYQPQIELEAMTIVGMEALLRWRHPQRGLLSPDRFVPIAEDRGLILQIGEWVLGEACREAKRFHDLGLTHFRVAVNISARQFRDEHFPSVVEAALEAAALAPDALELEITETVTMEDVALTLTTLEGFRRLGVTIAIDDFGTGHSSLSYLKRFSIDALKIDRGFVSDLPDGFEDAAIVMSVIHLANGLGLRVIAEGVETVEQLEFLRENGCREAQGFYFGQPVSGAEMERLVMRQTWAVSDGGGGGAGQR